MSRCSCYGYSCYCGCHHVYFSRWFHLLCWWRPYHPRHSKVDTHMFRWLHRSVNHVHYSDVRNEIAQGVRALRASCFGRSCLKECIKRMTAAAPVRRSRRGGAAAVAALLMLSMSAHAVVFCRWTGSEYNCSGGGDTVSVIGGGDGWQGDIIVTNIVGVCTNCVAMSPDFVRQWKIDAKELLYFCQETAIAAKFNINDAISRIQDAVSDYPIYLSPYYNTSPGLYATNWLASVGIPYGPPANRAAKIVNDMSFAAGTNSQLGVRTRITAYDGAASMYNSLCPQLGDATNILANAYDQVEDVRSNCSVLYDMVDELSDEQCTAQWGSGGGSTIVTNQTSGNWCTYDQGEAIIDLLRDIKDWELKLVQYASNILIRAESIDKTIKSALFTSYTHIPTEEELESTWQELYLSGRNDNFPEYQSTNIVARIELLLAGISGVLTNVNCYAEQDEFADDSLSSTNLVEESLGSFTNEFIHVMQSQESGSRSVGNALVSLYQKFRTWSGTPFTAEALINSYSVEFESGKSLDVPGFSASARTLPWANLLRVLCRSAMSVIWILMSVAVFVRFQIAFFQWCFKYVKWAVEILQGLFV